jgi:hypothetical protein
MATRLLLRHTIRQDNETIQNQITRENTRLERALTEARLRSTRTAETCRRIVVSVKV